MTNVPSACFLNIARLLAVFGSSDQGPHKISLEKSDRVLPQPYDKRMWNPPSSCDRRTISLTRCGSPAYGRTPGNNNVIPLRALRGNSEAFRFDANK